MTNRTGAALRGGAAGAHNEAAASLPQVPSTIREPALLIETRWVCHGGGLFQQSTHSTSSLRRGRGAQTKGKWRCGGASSSLGLEERVLFFLLPPLQGMGLRTFPLPMEGRGGVVAG